VLLQVNSIPEHERGKLDELDKFNKWPMPSGSFPALQWASFHISAILLLGVKSLSLSLPCALALWL